MAHYRRGETPCQPCSTARSEYMRAQRSGENARARARSAEKRTPRDCPQCGVIFTPQKVATQRSCSRRCGILLAIRERRAREAGATGSWTWSEFMRIAAKFEMCCAYCGERPDVLEPDHVVPLSRGGSNAPSNLLPACKACNSSKCALMLWEWAEVRARKNRAPRVTQWPADDPRYAHLTDVVLARRAA